jgi:Trp operon repressor
MKKSEGDSSLEWEKFLELFMDARDEETFEMIFRLFLTQNEREMLIDRYRLVRALLTTPLSQREIAESLQLSISKITAGSKATQSLPEHYKAYLANRMK